MNKIIKIKSTSEIPKDFTGIVEFSNGTKYWYLNGKKHRETGPAIEWADGTKSWFLNGKQYSEEDWKKEVEKLKMDKTIKVKAISEIPNDFTGIAEYPNGTKFWYLNGELHRENGPACEFADGTKYWYLNGKKHRENDLPAVEWVDGSKFWHLNGERHRETGPAVEFANGYKAWYLNGKEYSEEDWKKEVEKLKMNKTIKVESILKVPKDFTGIAEYPNGTKFWYLNGKLHRENDLPAIELSNGTKEWWLNGKPYDFSKKSNSATTQQLTIQGIDKKGENMMENLNVVNNNDFTNILKEDGKLILKRAAGRKIVNVAASLLAGFLTMGKTKKQSKSIQNAITETLQTENGKAMLGFLLGTFLPIFLEQIPKKYHEITKEMAQEFRVESGAHFATVAMDFLTGPMFTGAKNTFIEALDTILPQTEDNLDSKIRVSVNNNNNKAEIEEVNQKEGKQNACK